MAIGKQVADKLQLVVEVVSNGAEAALRKLSGSTKDAGDAAESAGGKLKGLGVSADMVAKVAGPAIAGFAIKAVKDFGDLAGGVLSFQRATQLSAEQSSKWVAVMDDYGISAQEGAAAVGKFEKAVATTPGKLAALGVAISKNRDGTVDLQATLSNAAEAFATTDDATRRAELGAALFGKSWQTMIPILEKGASGLTEAFGNVQDAQILNEDDLKTAEEFRLTMDDLGDAVKGMSIQVGRLLVPALKDAADEIQPLLQAMDWLEKHTGDQDRGFKDLTKTVRDFGPAIAGFNVGIDLGRQGVVNFQKGLAGLIHTSDDAKKGTDAVTAATANMSKAAIDAAETAQVLSEKEGAVAGASVNTAKARHDEAEAAAVLKEKESDLAKQRADSEDAANRLAKAEQDIRDRRKELTDHANDDVNAELNYRDAHRDTEKAIRDAIKANDAAKKNRSDPQAVADAEAAQDAIVKSVLFEADAWLEVQNKTKDTKDGAQEYANKIDDTAGALREQFPEVAAILDQIRDKWNNISASTADASKYAAGYGPSYGAGPIKARAGGGPVQAGEPYLIGEQGPEIMVPSQSGVVIPNGALKGSARGSALGGAGGGNTLIINATSMDPKGVLDVLQSAARVHGADAIKRILGIT